MPLSRSPRMDRRRRAIREGFAAAGEQSDEGRVSPSRTARTAIDLAEPVKKDRGVAYSHSVRRACQHRLVQFIPVRKLSLTGAITTSVAVPFVLMTLHYLIFVSQTLDWSGHPMSTLLNANSPRSLAAWLSSHLWLLCLAATIFTFRLRKHKLDDYEGEYRLWFWLVFTCVIGSIDSTTQLTELFGAALDRWSQLHVGWTGGAIVQATLATLVGMLGLRLCSELKSVPASLVLWLLGLSCWAASAALSQTMLRIDIGIPTRNWLRASLWLGGLTSIWLCGLLYLRAVFMEAQQRFLARTAMAGGNTTPWRERLSQAIPKMPKFRRGSAAESEADLGDRVANAPRRQKAHPTTANAASSSGNREQDNAAQASAPGAAPPKRRWGLGGLSLRPPAASTASGAGSATDMKTVQARRAPRDQDDFEDEETSAGRSAGSANTNANASPRAQAAPVDEIEKEYGKRPNWFRRRTQSDTRDNDSGAPETSAQSRQPSVKATNAPLRSKMERQRNGDDDASGDVRAKRSLRDRLQWKRKPVAEGSETVVKKKTKPTARDDARDSSDQPVAAKRKWLSLPKPRMPKVGLPKPRLPKLKMPSFRLPPPAVSAEGDDDGAASRVPSVNSSRPLPSTSGSFKPNLQSQDNDTDGGRGMSKAERKRLKRMQRDDDGERRAA